MRRHQNSFGINSELNDSLPLIQVTVFTFRHKETTQKSLIQLQYKAQVSETFNFKPNIISHFINLIN